MKEQEDQVLHPHWFVRFLTTFRRVCSFYSALLHNDAPSMNTTIIMYGELFFNQLVHASFQEETKNDDALAVPVWLKSSYYTCMHASMFFVCGFLLAVRGACWVTRKLVFMHLCIVVDKRKTKITTCCQCLLKQIPYHSHVKLDDKMKNNDFISNNHCPLN